MRLLLRFCASCAFLRPSLLVLFAAFAGHLAAQPANVQADPTTGALFRPAAATFISGNSLLTTSAAAAAYQPLDADLTSWAAVVRAGGFDTFTATPSSANLATLVTGETGSGALVFGTSPTFTTPTLGAATATSITAPASTDLTLAGGTSGASLVLGQGTSGASTLTKSQNSSNTLSILNATSGASARTALYLGNETQSTRGALHVFSDSWTTSNQYVAGTSLLEATGSAGLGISGTTNGPIRIWNNALNTATFTSTGNLLIGTTTDATSLAGGLVINGSGTAAASSGTNTGALRVTGGVGVSGSAFIGGDVTITRGASGGYFSILTSGTTAEQGILFTDSGGASGAIVYAHSTDTMILNAAGSTRLSLTSSAATFAGAVSLSAGTLTATNAAATQGIFKGWNSRSGANADNGQVDVGGATGLRLMSDASGTGGSVIDDRWDNAASSLVFRLRGNGTPVTSLTEEIGRASCRERVCHYV